MRIAFYDTSPYDHGDSAAPRGLGRLRSGGACLGGTTL